MYNLSMQYQITKHIFSPKRTFKISRGVKTSVQNVLLRLQIAGLSGWGEASPNAFYNEDAHTVVQKLEDTLSVLQLEIPQNQAELEAILDVSWKTLQPSHSALCALDLALWDLMAKKQKCSVSELVWGKPLEPVLTSVTLGIADKEEWEARFEDVKDFPVIKIKSHAGEDGAIWDWLHAHTKAKIRVDANASWQHSQLQMYMEQFSKYNIEMIEQPLAPIQDADLRGIPFPRKYPIYADESARTIDDLDHIGGLYDGINIKLTKCGGLTAGLKLLKAAKNNGLDVMVGCMLESDVLISAGLVLAQQAKFADLDGQWLLNPTPFGGVSMDCGILKLKNGYGLQVSMQ